MPRSACCHRTRASSADNFARTGIELHLIEWKKRSTLQRKLQLFADPAFGHQLVLQLLREELYAIASGGLGVIERDIGFSQQIGVAAVRRPGNLMDAPDCSKSAPKRIFLRRRRCTSRAICCSTSTLVKLTRMMTNSSPPIRAATLPLGAPPQPQGGRTQHGIAGRMTISVVDLLELIEIEV